MSTLPVVLSFGLSDATGATGLQADVLAVASMGCHPAGVVTAVASSGGARNDEWVAIDEELLEAKAAVDRCGVGCEPASAASVAGVRALVRQGTIDPAEHVVAVLTGHVLKDPGILLQYHRDTEPPPPGANRPLEIEPRLEEVARVLEAVTGGG